MPVIIEYLLKVSIALAIVYLFYQFVLRRLTFYNWNRWYLVGYSLLCFAIPFMNITDFLFRHELDGAQFVQLVPVYNLQLTDPGFEWNQWTVSIVILVTGMLIMGIRIVIQLFSLQRIKTRATLLNEGTVKLFDVNEHIVPFSFNNGIYINRQLHTDAELQEIIRHEFVHIKQKHSIDILLAELLCMLLWFHPAAWLIRKAIRQNLEFIADEKVLQDGVDKKQYQYLLLKVVGNTNYSIAPNFNFSSLKNRIIMMNQIKSARVQIIRFLFVLPLLAVLLLAFREVRQKEQHHGYVQQKALLNDTFPADQIAEIKVTKNSNQQSITIVLKDGTSETYNLGDEKQKAAFEKKYGKLDPPPPPIPGVQKNVIEIQKNIRTVNFSKEKEQNIVRIRLKNGQEEVYNIDKIKEKEQMEAKYGKLITAPPPPPPAPAVLNNKGYYLTVADDGGECVVIIKDKSKKIVKAMLLTEWTKEEAVNEKKYGKIPPPPPPVEVSVVAPVNTTVAVSAPAEVSTITNMSTANEVTVTGYATKSAVAPVVVEGKQLSGGLTGTAGESTVRLKGVGAVSLSKGANTENVLYILDGKEIDYEEMANIEPNTIESISVLKDDAATKAYGQKGKNGVIIIKTKTKKTSF